MTEYRLMVPMWATAFVDLEVPDEVIAEGEERVREWVMENAHLPQICAQCSGWGHQKEFLELSDDADWDKAEVEPR